MIMAGKSPLLGAECSESCLERPDAVSLPEPLGIEAYSHPAAIRVRYNVPFPFLVSSFHETIRRLVRAHSCFSAYPLYILSTNVQLALFDAPPDLGS